jgi:hypothetical protein
MRRAWVWASGFAALAGCVGSAMTGPSVPDGSITYRIDPSSIQYHFTDIRVASGGDLELSWLPLLGFTGDNCVALLPRSATDTVGTFVFAYAGPNTGRIARRRGAITDTVPGYFLPAAGSDQGTHGSYAVGATGLLKLAWADGIQTQYFDPGAVLRLVNDTITATADLRFVADSVRYTWHVSWVREAGC